MYIRIGQWDPSTVKELKSEVTSWNVALQQSVGDELKRRQQAEAINTKIGKAEGILSKLLKRGDPTESLARTASIQKMSSMIDILALGGVLLLIVGAVYLGKSKD